MSAYPKTRLSLLGRVLDGDATAGGTFYRDYRGPLAAWAGYARGQPLFLADELAHDFLVEIVVAPRLLETWDSKRGSFHVYLRTAFGHYISPRKNKKARREVLVDPAVLQECMSAAETEPSALAAGRETAFDKRFALDRILEALASLRRELSLGDRRRWQLFLVRELNPIMEGKPQPKYAEFYDQLGYTSEKQAMDALAGVCRSIRVYLRRSVKQRITTSAEIEREVTARAKGLLTEIPDLTKKEAMAQARKQVKQEINEEVDRTISAYRNWMVQPDRPVYDGEESDAGRCQPSSEDRNDSLAALVESHLLPPDDSVMEMAKRKRPPLPDLERYDLRQLAALLRSPDSRDPHPLTEALDEFLAMSCREFLSEGIAVEPSLPDEAPQFAMNRLIRDLLLSPGPHVQLLRAVKEEIYRMQDRGDVPEEVTSALYFATVAAARRSGVDSISDLSVEGLHRGLRWISASEWIDVDLRLVAAEMETMVTNMRYNR